MEDNFAEIKRDLQKYMKQGRIAVFVGAGVSALSDYPSWSDLVLLMSKKIDYKITLRDCKGNDCLSADEYLKIPQCFYNKNSLEYLEFVRKQLNVKKEPNDIHKLIMRIKPRHILTTNYDTLIEQSANRAGMQYSVINSDAKVSVAQTSNYILKVHGDFEKDNFVLKEQDYLNYETDFKLIDNLVKSIFSTNQVVFLGYGLGDYNIKLILNWVKNAQMENFIEPVFIYTGDSKLTEIEIKYYKENNLKVVDANRYFDNSIDTVAYMDKYKKALSELFFSEIDSERFSSNKGTVDYFYKRIEPLKDVKYLRIDEIAGLFPGTRARYKNQLVNDDFEYLIQVINN